MEIEEIISELKNLKLNNEPINEVRKLIQQIGKIAYMTVLFHKGKSVVRARPNEVRQFSHKNDLSFKPQECNTTYQRASTPNQTMFYAASLPAKLQKGELDNEIFIGVLETIPWIRDTITSGYKKITFGEWNVEEDLNLIAVIHKDTFYEESSYTKGLVDDYNRLINMQDKEILEKSLKFQYFLADEFSKEINNHTDYLISAIFTELAIQNSNIDGIIYPSVRVFGKGFNVAIKPNSCTKLKLHAAKECSVYKHKDKTIIDIDSIAKIDKKTDSFEFKEIKNYRKECLYELGVQSIDELK